MLSSYVATVAHEFQITVETDDARALMAAPIMAGGTGGVSGLQTVQAFSAGEVMAAQKKAGGKVAGFKAARK